MLSTWITGKSTAVYSRWVATTINSLSLIPLNIDFSFNGRIQQGLLHDKTRQEIHDYISNLLQFCLP